jgi:hypothetical protein
MSEDWLPMLAAQERRKAEVMTTLDPSLPDLTRYVMAGDLVSCQDNLARLRAGEMLIEAALAFTGSYGRMTLLLAALDEGLVSMDEALHILPHWWTISDPDDTDQRLICLWEKASERKRGIVTDGGPSLPRRQYFTVWRGQRVGDPIGCAWSLDRSIAERFARGASYRAPIANPQVIEVRIPRGIILAYLTGRGESEVIINPVDLHV